MTPEDHSSGPIGCEELGRFVDGELAAAEAAAFRRHLVVCARCQQEMHGLMQLSALAEQSRQQPESASPEPSLAAIAAAERRSRPRRAAWVGVVGAMAMAAALVLALRGGRTSGPDMPTLLASLDSRTVSGWPSAAGPGQYRPYAVSRGTAQSTPPALARAELKAEEASDLRSIATLALLRRDFARADTALGQLPARPDVLADRGLVRMEQGRCEEALEYLDRALDAEPGYLPALFNRGLCLRQLGLPGAAAVALGKVSGASAGGWSTEAGTDRLAVEQRVSAQKSRESGIAGERRKLVTDQQPLPTDFITGASGRARSFFNGALASAGTRAELERLLPTARALDALAGGTVLESRVKSAIRSANPARVQLATRFRDWFLPVRPVPAADVAAFVAEAKSAGQRDQALEAFASFAPNDASALRASLVQESADPFHQLFFAAAQALEQRERGQILEAERLVRLARTRCGPSLELACWYLDQQSIEIETLLGRFREAASQAEQSADRMRRLGALGEERNALLQLGDVKLAADRLAAARATFEEIGLREPAQCRVTVYRNEILAQGYVRRRDGRSADALLAAEPPCDQPMDYWRLELRVDLAQLSGDAGRMREMSSTLGKASVDPSIGPRERYFNGLLLERVRAELDDPAIRAERKEQGRYPDDLEVSRARARAGVARYFAALRRGDVREAMTEIAPAAGATPAATCALAVARDLSRTGWAAIGASGERASAWSSRDDRAISALVSPEAQRLLANCTEVSVLTTADLHGVADLLPDSLAWSFRVASRETPTSSSSSRLLVRDPRPPPELGLPPLRVEGLPQGPGWTVLEGPAATPARVLEAMGRAGFVEFAVHGLIDAQLPDGAMLMLSEEQSGAYALSAAALRSAQLTGRPLVILGACHAGTGSDMRDEPWSLPRAMVDAGARAVIASRAELPDAEASQFFEGIRHRVESGASPRVALRDERLAWLQKGKPWVREVVAFQ